jgi:hypothetical protein
MSTHPGPSSEQAPQTIVPVRPATSHTAAVAGDAPVGLLRRTLGVRVPSRRTLGFKDHSRRTLGYKSQSRRTLWGRRGGSQRILS